jgi:hypothetical protein
LLKIVGTILKDFLKYKKPAEVPVGLEKASKKITDESDFIGCFVVLTYTFKWTLDSPSRYWISG